MKSAVKAVVLFTLSLALFAPVLAIAQSLPGQFQHVIIVIQENRTPDNLFAGIPSPQPTMYPWFESGVDLAIAPQTPHKRQRPSGRLPIC
jgi:phospholipase C